MYENQHEGTCAQQRGLLQRYFVSLDVAAEVEACCAKKAHELMSSGATMIGPLSRQVGRGTPCWMGGRISERRLLENILKCCGMLRL